jgi:hypothetical protein
MQCRLNLSIFVVFILFVAVFVPITIQVYDYYINRKEGFLCYLKQYSPLPLLLATDETTHFTKERGGLDVHTTMQEQSIVPEPQTIRHHYVYYKSKQDVPKQIYYSKKWIPRNAYAEPYYSKRCTSRSLLYRRND